ncbi:MAG: OmpH family outer membrane protein [Planctomycetota bacterium]|nr:OmpH family outer membrane protein [Planctomycetota bacterium]
MRIKAVVLSCLVCAVVLFVGYEYSQAQPKADKPTSKIGIVSVRKAFRNSKKNSKYREQTIAEQTKIDAEDEKLSKEIEAQEAGLKALKPGSSDHLAQFKVILEKRANLEAQRQFNKQHRGLKDHRWTEELYREILRITNELAQQKGLDLVVEADEPEFPVESANELMMTLSTHKVLYSGGCLDLTDEVVGRLDVQESTTK